MTDHDNGPAILDAGAARSAAIAARIAADDAADRLAELERRAGINYDYWHEVRPAFEIAVERALDGIVADMPARTFADYRRNMAVAVAAMPGLLDAAMERACRDGLQRWPMD